MLITLLLVFSINSVVSAQVPGKNPDISGADIMYHIMFLASDELGGRKSGTSEGRKAAAYIAGWFEDYGLKPAGDFNSYFQVFEFTGGVEAGPENRLTLRSGDTRFTYKINSDYVPYGFSANGTVSGKVVFAGYGITSKDDNYDDYADIDVKDKIVVVLTGRPDIKTPDQTPGMYSSPRFKAITAANNGAAALIIATGFSDGEMDELPGLKYDQMSGKTGIPVLHVHRDVAENILSGSKDIKAAEKEISSSLKPASFDLKGKYISVTTDLNELKLKSQNVVGLLEGSDPVLKDRMIVVGAHYDHIGLGGDNSTAPSQTGQVHNGADDNASGTAGIMELAQMFSQPGNRLKRSVLFIAFGAEELGLLGSNHYVENPVSSLENVDFMINFDMIGRMVDNTLLLNGTGSSPVWKKAAEHINDDYGLTLKFSEGALGGSDHTAFYSKEIPVMFFFTGTHSDYHKPSDDHEKIDPEGEVRILKFTEDILRYLDTTDEKIAFTRVQEQAQPGRRAYRVTLGVVPDFAGSENEGFKITDVRPGGPADKAGLKGGDTITKMADKVIKNIYDYMYMLGELKEGQEIDIIIKRDEKEISFKVKLEKRKR